ncbi:MAG: glycoside hydrolase family 2 TIM barrel-domain containing protein [Clostridia bacterium]|nr:glycoside hydrolase family 2 TIM barrel-domain containing protein [Clostridia bacterium]
MRSVYFDSVDRNLPLPEYPRPQLRRSSYICLNGVWQCAFMPLGSGAPERYEHDILVPFSPETELSGVKRALTPDRELWYHRRFELPDGFVRGRVILHFGAVDQTADVFVNGTLVASHTGGYTPFKCDITQHLSDCNELTVRVTDITDAGSHSRGKQKTKRGGIWYTPQSGIWQTVWLESVPETYVTRLRILPSIDDGSISVTVYANADAAVAVSACGSSARGVSGEPITLKLDAFELWSPENPKLYELSVECGDDMVESYFGMRKFEVREDKSGVKRLFLNGEPYFHTGVLDQGYYCDGLLTPPCDQAMIDDISLMKRMGFNTLRKHIKVEPLRWYYHCDRLGMLVWQDMVNGGSSYKPLTVTAPCFIDGHSVKDNNYALFAREDAAGRAQYYRELRETVNALVNCVSIAMWVPFNEGWGQFDAATAVRFLLDMDSSRTIDHASGWHDQRIGDTKSLHVYFKPYEFKPDELKRAVMLTEFGGYSLRIEGHSFGKKTFGYKGCATPEELLSALRKLYENEIIPAKALGLCAAIYTQLSDVEDEVNGFITYDRAVVKLDPNDVLTLNAQLADRR